MVGWVAGEEQRKKRAGQEVGETWVDIFSICLEYFKSRLSV